MLTLRFHSVSEVILGPTRAFCIQGAFLRQHPHDEIVARHVDGRWHFLDDLGVAVSARHFECRDPCELQFEDQQGRTSPRFGRFNVLEYRDECIFADGEPFATRSPTSRYWQHRNSGVRWPILNLVTPRGS